jgi:hypothetical protein
VRNRKLAVLSSLLVASSVVVALGGIHRARLGEMRSLTLPSQVVLDEHAEPLIAPGGKVGFVASVTAGSLISFSVNSGKILNTISVGENVGLLSMTEVGGKRLIAVPAANRPTDGSPATVSIIDATDARTMEAKAILVLPPQSLITAATRALLSADGRYCFIASSFEEPDLLSFEVQSGQLISRIPMAGRPSEVAIYESHSQVTIALVSTMSNSVLLTRANQDGVLSVLGTFSPVGARFEDCNNPAFSSDGATLFVGAAIGDRLYAIDSESAIGIASVSVPSPFRVSVAQKSDASYVAVTHLRRSGGEGRGGVAIFATEGNRLNPISTFEPPEGVEFSRTNNAVFTSDGATAFVGSASGVLFAFSSDSGELESYNVVGNDLRRIALSEEAQAVAAIRSTEAGDQVVVTRFDLEADDGSEPGAPIIDSLMPSVVEQGRLRGLRLTVLGQNLTQGSAVVVNGTDFPATLVRNGTALQTRLPKELFDQVGSIGVSVRAANGVVSIARDLIVTRPNSPVIDQIEPTEVPGPAQPFTVQVKGANFRSSSAIFVGDQPLNTERLSDKKLRATIPAEIAGTVASWRISVRDLAVSDLSSPTDKELLIFGPRISSLSTSADAVVAGDKRFLLKIVGDNFRPGAQVELSLNGHNTTATRVQVKNKKTIKLRVGSNAFQDSGSMAVAVRNLDGAVSEPSQLLIHGPEISQVSPGKILAGMTDVRVILRGAHFRKQARVYVGNAAGAFRVDRKRVNFHTSRRIVVTLTGELNELLATPGDLRFSVVNPNSADGVPSIDSPISVVPPIISDATVGPTDDQGFERIVIKGENFRRGALVEFLVDDMVVRQQVPLRARSTKLTLVVRKRKLEAMRAYEIRVVNPGDVPSEPVSPHASEASEN